jgi:hypothetical protein
VGDIGDGAAFGNLELGAAVLAVGRKKCGQSGEESDLDPHLNPP